MKCRAVGPHPQQEAQGWGLLSLQQGGHAAIDPQSHTPTPELPQELEFMCARQPQRGLPLPWASLAGKAEKPGSQAPPGERSQSRAVQREPPASG